MENLEKSDTYAGFISYARIDNDKIAREPMGWVECLHRDLTQLLSSRLGKEVNLWLDQHEIRSYEDFTEKITKRLERTAVFLAVVSPAFVKRQWPQQELELFAKNAEQHLGLKIADRQKSRIFKIQKVPVKPDDLPKPMQGTGVYEFHAGKPPREFRPLLHDEFGKGYYERLNDLAHDIAAVLEELAGSSTTEPVVEAKEETPKQPAADRLTVYLAETTAELQEKVDLIKRELKSRGYVVVPDMDMPHRGEAYKEKVRELLNESALAIHLVGAESGFVPEGEARSNLWLQTMASTDRAKADPTFQRLIWMPAGVQPANPQQRELIAHLEEEIASQAGTDLLNGRIEDLKARVLEKLERIVKARQEQKRLPQSMPPGTAPNFDGKPSAGDDLRRIYVICEKNDRNLPSFKTLCRHLFEQGYEAIPAIEGAIEKHVDRLQNSDAILIYYGSGSSEWFELKLDDLRKYVNGRQKPLLAKAIYIAPSPSGGDEDKDMVFTREARILRGGETFSPEMIEPFVQELRSASNGNRNP